MSMTKAEYDRIVAGFEECSRIMQLHSAEISKLKEIDGQIMLKLQKLQDALAMTMVKVDNATRPPVKVKELLVGDKVRTTKGATGSIESACEAFVVDVDGKKSLLVAEDLTRVK